MSFFPQQLSTTGSVCADQAQSKTALWRTRNHHVGSLSFVSVSLFHFPISSWISPQNHSLVAHASARYVGELHHLRQQRLKASSTTFTQLDITPTKLEAPHNDWQRAKSGGIKGLSCRLGMSQAKLEQYRKQRFRPDLSGFMFRQTRGTTHLLSARSQDQPHLPLSPDGSWCNTASP